jgi:hypothetical protein
MLEQRRVDLIHFYAETPDLNLKIGAAEEIQRAVGQLAHEVPDEFLFRDLSRANHDPGFSYFSSG